MSNFTVPAIGKVKQQCAVLFLLETKTQQELFLLSKEAFFNFGTFTGLFLSKDISTIFLKGILCALIMGVFSGQLYKYLAILLFLACVALVTYVLISEYEKLNKINTQLRAILFQSENLNNDE